MEACIVSEHERWHIRFPVQGRRVNKSGEIFCNSFIADLNLAVALWVIAWGSGMLHIERFEELLSHEICKFFTLVCNNFKRQTKATNPPATLGSFFPRVNHGEIQIPWGKFITSCYLLHTFCKLLTCKWCLIKSSLQHEQLFSVFQTKQNSELFTRSWQSLFPKLAES